MGVSLVTCLVSNDVLESFWRPGVSKLCIRFENWLQQFRNGHGDHPQVHDEIPEQVNQQSK